VNQDVIANRVNRLRLFREVVVEECGVVNQAMAAWLLSVSSQRVHDLVIQGKLISHRKLDGCLLIPFASVEQFAREKRRKGRPQLKRRHAKGKN